MTQPRSGGVRLSDHRVRELRERYAAGARQVQLADEFGIGQNTVSNLVTGRSRASAGGPLSVAASKKTAKPEGAASASAARKPSTRAAPLTSAQAENIRGRVVAGEARAAVAGELGVSIHTVNSIMSGRRKGRDEAPERQFSADDVVRMRVLFNEGVSQGEIAERFATQQQAVSQIVRGKTYADFGGPIAVTSMKVVSSSGERGIGS